MEITKALFIIFSNGTKSRHKPSKSGSKRLRNGDCQKRSIERKISPTIKEESGCLLSNKSLDKSDEIKDCFEDTKDGAAQNMRDDKSSNNTNKALSSIPYNEPLNEDLSVCKNY